MRSRVALLIGVCMIVGATAYIVFFRDRSPSRAELAERVRADGAYVLADLARAFGPPEGAPGLKAPEPVGLDPATQRPVFDKVMRYRVMAYDLVGRAGYALGKRGYRTEISVMHSGEGTFGDARAASGAFFKITSGDLFPSGYGNLRVSGYLPS
jgi:hypothetical protein